MKQYLIEYIDQTYAGTLSGDFMRTKLLGFANTFNTKREAKDFINKFAPLSKELPYNIRSFESI